MTAATTNDALRAARRARARAVREYYRAIDCFGFGGYETVPARNRLRRTHATLDALLRDEDIREITGAEPTDAGRAAWAEMVEEMRAESGA